MSRNRIASVVDAAKRSGMTLPELLRLDEATLYRKLYPEKAAEPVRVKPDFAKIHSDLLKDGVALTSLWEEYTDACKAVEKPPYMNPLSH